MKRELEKRICLVLVAMAISGNAAEAPAICIDTGRQLFVDDYLIASTKGVVRHWNKPIKEENPVVWPGGGGCVSRNGNLLLNVGPTELGEIPEGSVKLLKALADWQAANGESVTGCGKSEFTPPYGCVYTQRGKTLYCHFLQSPLGDTILPQLKGRIAKATLLRTLGDVGQINSWGFELLKPDEQRIRARGVRPGDVVRLDLK